MQPSALQYEIYRIVAPLCALALAVELACAWQKHHRRNPGTPLFTFVALAVIGFLVTNVMEISTRSEALSYSWSRAMYAFMVFIPLAWLMFSLQLTTGKAIESWWVLALLLLVPVATLVVVFSSSLVHLIWPSVHYSRVGGYAVARWEHGTWFWIFTVHTYGVSIAACVITLRAFVLRRTYYRSLSVFVLLGVLTPMAANLLYLVRPFPGLVKDYTPVGYAVGVTFFFFALYRRDLFTVVPVARDQLVERLRVGILVVDGEGRVLDANPAALGVLGLDEKIVGQTLRSVAEGGPPLPEAVRRAVDGGPGGEFSSADEHTVRHYSVDVVPLRRMRSTGRLIVIQDETKVRELLARVEILAREDDLTGLWNRRSFMEAAGASFSLAARHGESLCVAMFDLDEFKGVNDSHGHAAGDCVLKAFARILSSELRASDFSCRYGGEEFAALLPHTDLTGALKVCERVRLRFAEGEVAAPEGVRVRATVSAGLAALDSGIASMEALLAAADAALYRAKAAGRNCVRCADGRP